MGDYAVCRHCYIVFNKERVQSWSNKWDVAELIDQMLQVLNERDLVPLLPLWI
jgi:hypothetical protein